MSMCSLFKFMSSVFVVGNCLNSHHTHQNTHRKQPLELVCKNFNLAAFRECRECFSILLIIFFIFFLTFFLPTTPKKTHDTHNTHKMPKFQRVTIVSGIKNTHETLTNSPTPVKTCLTWRRLVLSSHLFGLSKHVLLFVRNIHDLGRGGG